METELYEVLLNKLLESGLSKRKFSEKYNISHSWLIDFMNPDIPFRPLQIKTQGVLFNNLDIPYKISKAYNDWVYSERGE